MSISGSELEFTKVQEAVDSANEKLSGLKSTNGAIIGAIIKLIEEMQIKIITKLTENWNTTSGEEKAKNLKDQIESINQDINDIKEAMSKLSEINLTAKQVSDGQKTYNNVTGKEM